MKRKNTQDKKIFYHNLKYIYDMHCILKKPKKPHLLKRITYYKILADHIEQKSHCPCTRQKSRDSYLEQTTHDTY